LLQRDSPVISLFKRTVWFGKTVWIVGIGWFKGSMVYVKAVLVG